MKSRHSRSYTDFPAEYTELFMRFAAGTQARLGPLDKSSAASSRRDLDRFRTAVRIAAEADDSLARQLRDTVRDVVLRTTEEPDGWYVTLTINPVVAAMRGAQ